MALVKTTLPKSRSGRKPTPLDAELVEALITALKAESVDSDGRPAAYGPDTAFETEGKATSQGRKYANAVAEALKITVRVNSHVGEKGNAETGPFFWRCYIPLSASNKKDKSEKK
jgi:hypothetical protein